jgi:hypothetical protein
VKGRWHMLTRREMSSPRKRARKRTSNVVDLTMPPKERPRKPAMSKAASHTRHSDNAPSASMIAAHHASRRAAPPPGVPKRRQTKRMGKKKAQPTCSSFFWPLRSLNALGGKALSFLLHSFVIDYVCFHAFKVWPQQQRENQRLRHLLRRCP